MMFHVVQAKPGRKAADLQMSSEEFVVAGFMMNLPGSQEADWAGLDEGLRQRILGAFLQLKQQVYCRALGHRWHRLAQHRNPASQPLKPQVRL